MQRKDSDPGQKLLNREFVEWRSDIIIKGASYLKIFLAGIHFTL